MIKKKLRLPVEPSLVCVCVSGTNIQIIWNLSECVSARRRRREACVSAVQIFK